MANGHRSLAENELLVQAEKLLEIPSDTLAGALQAELASGEWSSSKSCRRPSPPAQQ
jgi:hypothetical protein